MFGRMFYASCVVGLICGLLLTGMQALGVVQIIAQAETYESQAPGTTPANTHQHADGHSHSHGDAWAPEDGLERTMWTSISNIATSIGFALLIIATISWRNRSGIKQGLLWGAVGFVAFFGSPALGLTPELPGAVAADLLSRQIWWLGTVTASALGLGLIIVARAPSAKVVGVVLLLVPHIIGAPHPQVAGGLAPQALAEQFVYAATITNALFWLSLGACCALAYRHFLGGTDSGSMQDPDATAS
jgi:cobalt transporter subunit CbtA